MPEDRLADWLPPVTTTADGGERRVGVEIELAGLEPKVITTQIYKLFGGVIHRDTRLEYRLDDTEFGEFAVELDTAYLKKLAAEKPQSEESRLESWSADVLTKAAEQLVPWEVVAPPIVLSELPRLQALTDALRNAGALGTRHALHYAFGLHLNPELPDHSVESILSYLRAYFCLYDWIAAREQTDFSRQLTSYIKHFDKDYIAKVIDWSYQPNLSELIDDYLQDNLTRNRSLDMLPLFAYLDSGRVKAAIDDPRIKARPTFHYRLPNCDIDNPAWNLSFPWGLWLEVEKLAGDTPKLQRLCREYLLEINRFSNPLDNRWAARIDELL